MTKGPIAKKSMAEFRRELQEEEDKKQRRIRALNEMIEHEANKLKSICENIAACPPGLWCRDDFRNTARRLNAQLLLRDSEGLE